MAKKKRLQDYERFTSVDSDDVIFGEKTSGGKYGFFPANLLNGNGYACRRWRLDMSSPVGEAVGNIDYLRNLPSLLGLGCYLVDDAHNRRKLDPTNHYKFASGEAAALDGSMGQYMWGWGTKFYIAWWIEGVYFYLAVSLKPIPGRDNYEVPVASISAFHTGVMDREATKLCSVLNKTARYRGGNGSALTSGNASSDNKSMLGYAATAISTQNFETYGNARGEGWGAGWYWIDTVILILAQLILGTRHIQTAFNATKDANGLYQCGLGGGIQSMPDWSGYNGYYPVAPLEAGIELADGVGVASFAVKNSSGTTVYNAPIPVFFGLKNPFGHLWVGKNRIVGKKNSDGSYSFYVAKSCLTPWNPSDIANMIHVGDLAAAASASWAYISKINYQGLAGMPSECNGTSSTYYADGAYRDVATSGFRSPLGGGYANNGSIDGLAYFNGNYAPSNSNANLSSPHYFVAVDVCPQSHLRTGPGSS